MRVNMSDEFFDKRMKRLTKSMITAINRSIDFLDNKDKTVVVEIAVGAVEVAVRDVSKDLRWWERLVYSKMLKRLDISKEVADDAVEQEELDREIDTRVGHIIEGARG